MSRFLSRRHSGLVAYVPGEQPDSVEEYIKLNTNESPYPPSPGVIAALNEREAGKLNLYPNPDGKRLKMKLAAHYGVLPENVIIGNGSDELLAFAFLAFCDGDRGVAFPDITYGFYPVYAELFGTPCEQIPLNKDLTIDLACYLGIRKNIIIANPNAPTGIALGLSDIEAVVESNPDFIVLIDEAYVDFGAESAIPLTKVYDNLLVMHTYSKSRSMAGARLAYAIGQEAVIDDLVKMKYSFNPYNVNRLTLLAGEAALDSEEYYIDRRREIIDTRAYTEAELKRLGFVMTESKANFIFAMHPKKRGNELYLELKERGVLVRHFDKHRISEYLRITIGSRAQMDALINAARGILN
ncbi:MAG: histidinol-phosphate transaminase [Oscillospiraceae bacterium]|nr:histidinol-phosphate transaminase [Oscillospiraceae bacterium]